LKLVMKFGGSLLGSKGGPARAASIVERSVKQGDGVVAVVSALGDVTDLLLVATSSAIRWNQRQVVGFVDGLRLLHERALGKLGLKGGDHNEATRRLSTLLEDLKLTLTGISMLRETTPRSTDLVLSFGERLSSVLVAAALEKRGVNADPLTGGEAGIVTDSSFGEANPDFSKTRRNVKAKLIPLLSKGTVPVVTGFIARTGTGETTTLGRGGSDFTATILADALRADEVWIWTDVDGLLSADPRLVKEARVLDEVSYAEAEEMAVFGAKNMHPLSLVPARRANIPVRIRNGFRPQAPGTLIHGRERKAGGVAKAVALVGGVGMITVSGESLVGRPGTAAKVFEIYADAKVNIRMISQSVSESNISVVVARESLGRASKALAHGLEAAGIVASVKTEPEVSVVSAFGSGMKGTPGVAARVFSSVAKVGVNVRMIAQGSSELSISFVVPSKDAAKALNALHSGLVLG
jgi:aspartate kinase